MIKFLSRLERIYSPLVLLSLMLYLAGLLFPIRVVLNMGFAGICVAAVLSMPTAFAERSRIAWGTACILMLVAGIWGGG